MSDVCGICREELISNIKSLICNHSFHEECINSWLDIICSCPFCRKDIEHVKSNNYIEEQSLELESSDDELYTDDELNTYLDSDFNTRQLIPIDNDNYRYINWIEISQNLDLSENEIQTYLDVYEDEGYDTIVIENLQIYQKLSDYIVHTYQHLWNPDLLIEYQRHINTYVLLETQILNDLL